MSKPKKKDRKPSNRNNLITIGILAFLSFLAHGIGMSNGFVNWDDPANFLDNPWIANPDGLGIIERIVGIFTSDVLGNYNPLSTASFLIDKGLFGFDNPAGWHFINIVLHFVVGLLVYRFILKLASNHFVALATAAFFIVHPMHVESVAWVTERKDLLYALFYFAALIQYLKYKAGKNSKNLVLLYCFFILSMLSKIQAVALPLSIIAIDIYQDKTFSPKSIISKAPLFLLSLVWGILGILFLQEEGSLTFGEEKFTLFENLVFGCYGFMVYVYKLIIPYPLSSYYPYPDQLNVMHYVSILGFVGLLGLIFWTFKKAKWSLFFGLTFFFVNTIFVVQFLKAGQGFLADRFSYVAYVGLLFSLFKWLDGKTASTPKLSTPIKFFVLIWALVFSYMSFEQTKVWKDGESLWTNVISKYPDQMRPYAARGNNYLRQGQLESAIEDYSKALEIKVNEDIYANRAKAIMQLPLTNENNVLAFNDLNQAILLNPNKAEYYINRGVIYTKSGQAQPAINDFTKALELDSNLAEAYLNRGKLYQFQGQNLAALRDLTSFLALRPNQSQVWFERALLETSINKLNEAIVSLDNALRGMPGNCAVIKQKISVEQALSSPNLNATLQLAQQYNCN